MKKKKRRSKYTDKKRAEECALKAFSAYIRERDNWTCITCDKKGNNKNIDAGHFISRSYSFLKFDITNVHAQCVKCNKYENGNWPKYYEIMCERYGKKYVEYLMSIKNRITKRTIQDYLMLEEHFKTKLLEEYGVKL